MSEQSGVLLRDAEAEPPTTGDSSPTHSRFDPLYLVDIAFVVLLLVTLVLYLRWSHAVVINSDDWLTAPRGNSLFDYFRPYGNNLSVATIAIYHSVFALVGFKSYWLLRFIGIASQFSIVIVLYLVLRARIGPAVALVSAVAVLWYPRLVLVPSLFNHWFALAGCVVALWALTRKGATFDLIAAVALTFALCSSAVGIAGAVGCLAYAALTRAPLRRWLAVGVPSALVAVWSVTLNRDSGGSPALPAASIGDRIHFVYNGILTSFSVMANQHWLEVVFAVGFVVVLAWRLRKGVRQAAFELACCAAILAWWIGLALERQAYGTQLRYRVVTIVFVLLALIPPHISAATRRRATRPLAVGVCVVLSAIVVAVNAPTVHSRAQGDEASYRDQLTKMIVLNLGPSIVANDRVVHFDLFTEISTGQYRRLVARYGTPEGTRPEHPDAAIVLLADVGLTKIAPVAGSCTALTGPTEVKATVDQRRGVDTYTRVVLRGGPTDTDVQLKRFEDSFVDLGRLPAGTTAQIDLPVLMTSTPWTISAPGACQVK